MKLLTELLRNLWGNRAVDVARSYQTSIGSEPLALRDMAFFCNVGQPIEGETEFARGVEEGKRQAFLHIAQMIRLNPDDFAPLVFDENYHRETLDD